jgi:hypothetical protein
MKPYEQILKINELMPRLDAKLKEVFAICEQAEELGANVPCSVLNGETEATEWWSFRCETVMKRLEKRQAVESALAKLTDEERRALGL